MCRNILNWWNYHMWYLWTLHIRIPGRILPHQVLQHHRRLNHWPSGGMHHGCLLLFVRIHPPCPAIPAVPLPICFPVPLPVLSVFSLLLGYWCLPLGDLVSVASDDHYNTSDRNHSISYHDVSDIHWYRSLSLSQRSAIRSRLLVLLSFSFQEVRRPLQNH